MGFFIRNLNGIKNFTKNISVWLGGLNLDSENRYTLEHFENNKENSTVHFLLSNSHFELLVPMPDHVSVENTSKFSNKNEYSDKADYQQAKNAKFQTFSCTLTCSEQNITEIHVHMLILLKMYLISKSRKTRSPTLKIHLLKLQKSSHYRQQF